jgi:hypothetical protein
MYYDVYWLEMVILSLNRHAHLKLERCAHTLYMSRFGLGLGCLTIFQLYHGGCT